MLIEPEVKILSIIDKRGYIHLDEFIEISLNKLELSYYRSGNPLGKNGDFSDSRVLEGMNAFLSRKFFR